jgi:hypothetical protein
MPLTTLNPTYEDASAQARPAPPLRTLEGATVGLLDNSKRNVGHFLAYVEEILRAEHGVTEVVSARKPNMSALAPDDVMARLTACDAVFSAIGD